MVHDLILDLFCDFEWALHRQAHIAQRLLQLGLVLLRHSQQLLAPHFGAHEPTLSRLRDSFLAAPRDSADAARSAEALAIASISVAR